MSNKTDIETAFEMAEVARQNSYSIYSKFKVGACIKTKSNKFFQGTNVENASFGATNCAERSAIQSMISNIGVEEIEFILLSTSPETIPCAICLQVMSEFFNDNTEILIVEPTEFKRTNKVSKVYKLRDLLRIPFNKEELNRLV